MKTYQKIIMLIVILLILAAIGYVCYGYILHATYNVENPVATIEIQDYGTVKIELYPSQAPNTVANFIALSNNGFYDGLTFHRVVEDFMIQGGDPNGDGSGSPTLSAIDPNIEKGSDADKEYSIKGEFLANKFDKNNIKFEKGVLAMARSDYSSLNSSLADEGYNSAGSQFFIMTEYTNSLNGMYAGFGKVIEGQEIVDTISKLEVEAGEVNEETGETTESDKPVNPPVITSIRVETHGIDYGMPKTQDPFDYYTWMMQQYYGGSSD